MSRNARQVVIRDNGYKRHIGFILGDTFYTFRKEEEHLYRGGEPTLKMAEKKGSLYWGLDSKAVDGMIKDGITWVVIIGSDFIYKTPLAAFKTDKAMTLHFKPHRPQYFLNVKGFIITPKTGVQMQIWREDGIVDVKKG